jgi:cysteine-rich repeat protein
MRFLALLILSGCTTAPVDRPAATIAPDAFCGDGHIDPFESCDDGPSNGDTEDACRADCTLPACGDAVADSDEGCDDGNLLGGDGCSPSCVEETGPLESEPNNSPLQASSITPGAWTRGGAAAGDVDCHSFYVPHNGFIQADVRGADGAECPAATVVSLHEPWGMRVAQGTPGEWACSGIDPTTDSGAVFLDEGTWIACVQGFLGGAVPAYDLKVEVSEGSCDLTTLPVDPNADPDGDGLIDQCDEDDDGDGVADSDDNCPYTPNGATAAPFAVDGNGFIRQWLTIGEFHGLESTLDCRPSLDQSLGDDANAAPHLGDTIDDLTWLPWLSGGRRIGFLDRYGGDVPREVYAVTWLRSDIERDVVLAAGVDDGFFAWLNGELVDDVSGCQGTNVDQFQSQVTLEAGWNRLMIKVRDQGGGWGMFVRFRDPDGPITDLEVSITPDGPWIDDQGDLDGDGIGDVCDDTPAG